MCCTSQPPGSIQRVQQEASLSSSMCWVLPTSVFPSAARKHHLCPLCTQLPLPGTRTPRQHTNPQLHPGPMRRTRCHIVCFKRAQHSAPSPPPTGAIPEPSPACNAPLAPAGWKKPPPPHTHTQKHTHPVINLPLMGAPHIQHHSKHLGPTTPATPPQTEARFFQHSPACTTGA